MSRTFGQLDKGKPTRGHACHVFGQIDNDYWFGEAKADGARERHEAIACYLSASEGWDEAVQRLGGAFAAEETGLKDHKAG